MKIEIISGSYGWRKTKDAMPKLIERGGICEVDEAEARRLVALGVAAIVHEADEAKAAPPPASICPAKKTAQRVPQRPILTRSSCRK